MVLAVVQGTDFSIFTCPFFGGLFFLYFTYKIYHDQQFNNILLFSKQNIYNVLYYIYLVQVVDSTRISSTRHSVLSNGYRFIQTQRKLFYYKFIITLFNLFITANIIFLKQLSYLATPFLVQYIF